MFKKIVSKLQAKKKAAGVQRIISLANALSKEITRQGYKLRDETGSGAIFVFLNSNRTITIESAQSGLYIEGK